MSETLQFGIEDRLETTRLYVDVPTGVYRNLSQTNERVSAQFNEMQQLSSRQKGIFSLVKNDDFMRIYVQSKRIGRLKQPYDESAIRSVLGIFNTLQLLSADPRLIARFGINRLPDNTRLGMVVRCTRPLADDEVLTGFVTKAMRNMATDLRYSKPLTIPGLVYAQVNAAQGVTLETNPLGSCSLDTDGMRYKPDSPSIELGAHNIYNRKQQLICFAGAVALAHADELLETS